MVPIGSETKHQRQVGDKVIKSGIFHLNAGNEDFIPHLGRFAPKCKSFEKCS